MQFSTRATIDEALKDFQMIRNCKPFKYSGKWFVVQKHDGFYAYRTKKTAAKHACGKNFWHVTM